MKKDLHTGLRWATLAADAGDRDAQELLATAFGRGHEDLQIDATRAVDYGTKAAQQGSVKSAELLGKWLGGVRWINTEKLRVCVCVCVFLLLRLVGWIGGVLHETLFESIVNQAWNCFWEFLGQPKMSTKVVLQRYRPS